MDSFVVAAAKASSICTIDTSSALALLALVAKINEGKTRRSTSEGRVKGEVGGRSEGEVESEVGGKSEGEVEDKVEGEGEGEVGGKSEGEVAGMGRGKREEDPHNEDEGRVESQSQSLSQSLSLSEAGVMFRGKSEDEGEAAIRGGGSLRRSEGEQWTSSGGLVEMDSPISSSSEWEYSDADEAPPQENRAERPTKRRRTAVVYWQQGETFHDHRGRAFSPQEQGHHIRNWLETSWKGQRSAAVQHFDFLWRKHGRNAFTTADLKFVPSTGGGKARYISARGCMLGREVKGFPLLLPVSDKNGMIKMVRFNPMLAAQLDCHFGGRRISSHFAKV